MLFPKHGIPSKSFPEKEPFLKNSKCFSLSPKKGLKRNSGKRSISKFRKQRIRYPQSKTLVSIKNRENEFSGLSPAPSKPAFSRRKRKEISPGRRLFNIGEKHSNIGNSFPAGRGFSLKENKAPRKTCHGKTQEELWQRTWPKPRNSPKVKALKHCLPQAGKNVSPHVMSFHSFPNTHQRNSNQSHSGSNIICRNVNNREIDFLSQKQKHAVSWTCSGLSQKKTAKKDG